MEELRLWSGPIASVIAIGTFVYAWLTAGSKANQEKIDGHDAKLREHDRRIQKVENEFEHLPSKDDVNELRVGLEQVKGSLGRLEESHLGVNRTVRRIEDFLLKGEG